MTHRGGVDVPEHKCQHLLRELLITLLSIVILCVFIWVNFFRDDFVSEGSEKLKEEINVKSVWDIVLEHENKQHETINALLQRGNLQLARNHLTWPENANALGTFLELLNQKGGERQAKLGLRKMGESYLRLLTRLKSQHDLLLLRETLQSAQSLLPYLPDDAYRKQLQGIAEDMEVMEQLRESRRRSMQAFAPFALFSDPMKNAALGPVMVALPAGTFPMGSPESEVGRDNDEGPVRQVTLAAFAISQAEITFAQYALFAERTGREIPDDAGWGGGNMPVLNVSWLDAKAYVGWLSEVTGEWYRLPTEAEWEYAARAGQTTPFYSGACISNETANFDGRSAYAACAQAADFAGQPLAVKSLQPNAWQLFDMLGNLGEWVEDCWRTGYSYPSVDGRALYSAEGGGCLEAGGKRVVRGGAWNSAMQRLRVANRQAFPETQGNAEIGFRVVRDSVTMRPRVASSSSE